MPDDLLADQPNGAYSNTSALLQANTALADMLAQVDSLLMRLSDAESSWMDWLSAISPGYRASARNLVHYWAIRQSDLLELQAGLAAFGLSSLGHGESHVQANLAAVRSVLTALLDGRWEPPPPSAVSIGQGPEILRRRAVELLGPSPPHRATRIMVTLPSEAATDPDLVRGLVRRGMNIARINCAHDDVVAWRSMVSHVRAAADSMGVSCLVAMDLGGTKLRTGLLEPGPRVVKLHPRRNGLGQVVVPAQAWLTSTEDPTAPPEPDMRMLTVPEDWLAHRRCGDVLDLLDARGSKRELVLDSAGESAAPGGGFVVTATKTVYLATGTLLCARHGAGAAEVGTLPEMAQSLVLREGDFLELTRDCSPAPVFGDGTIQRIGCTLPEVFDTARAGDVVHFDDGRLSGRVVSVERDVLTVRIDYPERGSARLKARQGINVPDTEFVMPGLTDRDIIDLSVVVELADLVEMSFIRTASDVERLLEELDRLGGDDVGVVLKIETQPAFDNLPQLLLTAMRRPKVGVMIARGDLALECGYERLAEMQEEIMWLCEAAHLPVIWAAQVLEQLAKTGRPSRAEISDAAMGERAECVMLNKGAHLDAAVTVLDNIMRRMAEHYYKKAALLRPLRFWSSPAGRDTDQDAGGRVAAPS